MIKILKLTTGEELVGEYSTSDENITLSNPCVIQIVPSRSNPEQPMLALIPYAPYTQDQKISFNERSVVWQSNPVKELYNQYNSIFGSGLIMPS